MNLKECNQALKEGKTVTHTLFLSDEFFVKPEGQPIKDQDGKSTGGNFDEIFFDNSKYEEGWSIVSDPTGEAISQAKDEAVKGRRAAIIAAEKTGLSVSKTEFCPNGKMYLYFTVESMAGNGNDRTSFFTYDCSNLRNWEVEVKDENTGYVAKIGHMKSCDLAAGVALLTPRI